jgi:hypothetical protein
MTKTRRGVLLALLVCAGCQPTWHRSLYEIDARKELRPVMISRAPAGGVAMAVEATSHEGHNAVSFPVPGAQVTLHFSERSRDAISAQLFGNLDKTTSWVQIEEATYEATDERVGHTEWNRNVSVRESAYR